VALLAVLGTPVDVAGLLVDGFTGGALLGLLVGVYDVRGRADRDRIQAFAQSVSALNTYGKALNSSQTLDEISALCVEAVEFLVAGDGAAFLLVDETAAEPTVTVVDSTLRGDHELAVLESLAVAVEPDEEIEAVRYAETSVDLGTDSPSAALVIAVETPEGRAMIVSLSTTTEIDYDDEDVDLLETLAAHVSTALSGVETTAPVGVDGD
jgi:GAF domain-containing protein